MMRLKQLIVGSVLGLGLLVSLLVNLYLGFQLQHQTKSATELRLELQTVRGELSDTRDELETLRSRFDEDVFFEQLMNDVLVETEAVRDLSAITPVTRHLFSQAEMGEHLLNLIEEDYVEEDIQRDQLVLSTLELVPPDMDLKSLLQELLTEQVAGLYEPDDETLYVVNYSGELGPLEETILSHEYTHALQDQYFDLEAMGFGDDNSQFTDDQMMAIQALVEGDATLLMQQYIQETFDMADITAFTLAASSVSQDAMNNAPPYMRDSFMFPYQSGLVFASSLYARGGWDAVDQAFTDLPQSTEQILHPERYPGDIPLAVTLPPLSGTLGSEWQLVKENVLGEFSVAAYLDTYLTQQQAGRAAAGWGGDRYALYHHPQTEEVVFVLRLLWDTSVEQTEFTDIYQQYAEARFGEFVTPTTDQTATWWSGDDTLYFATDGGETLIILASNRDLVELVLVEFGE